MSKIAIDQLKAHIPLTVQNYIISKFCFLFAKQPPPEVYEALQIYMMNKFSPSSSRLHVSKAPGEIDLIITIKKGQLISDFYQGIELKWFMVSEETEKQNSSGNPKTRNRSPGSGSGSGSGYVSLELRFLKIHKEVVLDSYLSHVMDFAASVKEVNRVVRLQSLASSMSPRNSSINFNHPSTFDTLAMDPTVKKSIDLDRFVERKDYYKKVGKAWKRGYLLYGLPGTGKSSLIAAMANYLKFHIYDLELTIVHNNMSLREMLISTENQSIIVIEDIDCTLQVQDMSTNSATVAYRQYEREEKKLTLSGLLNFIDGLWSSCGDQRIIIFTTNFKDKIDPALLRPGRMDMHIHMSYLTPCGFRVLAMNYLGLESHPLFTQIEELIAELEITPAMVAEQLLKCDNGDHEATLESLIELLEKSKVAKSEVVVDSVDELVENKKDSKSDAQSEIDRVKESIVEKRSK